MKKIFTFIVVILVVPIIVVNYKNSEIKKEKYGIYTSKNIRVKNSKTNEIYNVPLEEYIIGVVAGEIPALFNDEAIKAQAVASRTYVLKRINKKRDFDITDDKYTQVYITKTDMKKKWGPNFNKYYTKIKNNVLKSESEVITYDNKLIDALFFSTSNGFTENSEKVFYNKLPYLKSVRSDWDVNESPKFYSEKVITKEEFFNTLNINFSNQILIDKIIKNESERIDKISINNEIFTGKEIRKKFNLNSTSFDIKLDNNNITFKVKGNGHGVGMSQYGANGMAKKGYNYQEILKYYYTNCEIKKINNV